MKTIHLIFFVLLILFFSCNPAEEENKGFDMSDDRGTHLVNDYTNVSGLCWSADGSEIYYFTEMLYAVNISTKSVRIIDGRISNYSFSNRYLTLSDDGNKIFYISDNGNNVFSVYRVGTDGSNLKELVSDISTQSMAVTNDNNYIAYRPASNSNINIFKISDSTNTQYVLNAYPISFSPDGSKLMCVSSFFNNDKEIILMNVSDGNYQTVFSFSSYQYGCARWETDAIKMLYNPDTKNVKFWNSLSNTNTTIFTISEALMYTFQRPALNMGCTKASFWTRQCIKPKDIWSCDVMLYNLNLINLNNFNSSILSYFKFSGSHALPDDCIAFSNDGTKIAYAIDRKIYMREVQ